MQNTIIWVSDDTLERIVNIDGAVVCTQRVRISDKERCDAMMAKFWQQLLNEQERSKPGARRRR